MTWHFPCICYEWDGSFGHSIIGTAAAFPACDVPRLLRKASFIFKMDVNLADINNSPSEGEDELFRMTGAIMKWLPQTPSLEHLVLQNNTGTDVAVLTTSQVTALFMHPCLHCIDVHGETGIPFDVTQLVAGSGRQVPVHVLHKWGT